MAWTKNTAGYYTDEVIMQNITSGVSNVVSHYTDWFSYRDFGVPIFEYTLVVNPEHTLIGTIGVGAGLHNLYYKMWVEYEDNDGSTSGDIVTELTSDDWLDLTDDFTDVESHVLVTDIDAITGAGAVPALKVLKKFRFHFKIGAEANYSANGLDRFKVLLTPHN